MADPTTVNTSLAVPIRGTDTGTWDTPVNANFTSLDAMMGGVTSLALSSTSVTLATSQALVSVIRLTGTLLANVSITLPGIYKFWTIDNQLLNSPSSFAATLVSTSGASIIGMPPSTQDVFYDGTNVKYKNLGKFGEYWDYIGPTVPTWITASTIPPYLNCNGTTFSSATYPLLANHLGTTTLPDSRGRVRAALNAGTARITSIITDTIAASGGDQNMQLHSHGNSLNDPTHVHNTATAVAVNGGSPVNVGGTGSGGSFIIVGTTAAATGMSINNANAGGGAAQNVQPTYMGGITLLRAF